MTVSTKRGENHLGDLARALEMLKPQNDEQAKFIAACLGFGLQAAPAPPPLTEIYDRQRYRRPERPEPEPPQRPKVFTPPVSEPPPVLPGNVLTSRLQALTERAPAAPDDCDWLDEPDALLNDDANVPGIARYTLFHERTNRHILTAALTTRRVGQQIDMCRLIGAICRREVVLGLPRKPEPTLERGCQLLLDYSATMVPFWEDLNTLITQIKNVVGEANTAVYGFDSRPTQAFCWTPAGDQQAWEPDGRPVLAATDLGIQGKTGRAELDLAWTDLVEKCTRVGSPLVILIPWPEPRWPTGLGRYPKLLHWSPHTSAAMVQKMIGLGHAFG